MNQDAQSAKRVLVIIFCLLVAFAIYELVATIISKQTTGILEVTSANSATLLSISQDTRQATLIGTGSATVRLEPGVYHLAAFINGSGGSATVRVDKQHTTHQNLTVTDASKIPSPSNITINGTTDLLSNGLSSSQINSLKTAFFSFKSTIRTVNIDSNSIQPGPHDPNTDASFALNFTLTVDGSPYKATSKYSGSDDIQLLLYDPTSGAQVFDSGTLGDSE